MNNYQVSSEHAGLGIMHWWGGPLCVHTVTMYAVWLVFTVFISLYYQYIFFFLVVYEFICHILGVLCSPVIVRPALIKATCK